MPSDPRAAVRQDPHRDLQGCAGLPEGAGEALQVRAHPELLDPACPAVQVCA